MAWVCISNGERGSWLPKKLPAASPYSQGPSHTRPPRVHSSAHSGTRSLSEPLGAGGPCRPFMPPVLRPV